MAAKNVQLLTASRHTDFVVTVADLEKLGISIWAANRRVAAGEWQRLDRGIFLTHPFGVSWSARARVALIIGGPDAFLTQESAWFIHKMTLEPPEVITVGIPSYRRITPRPNLKFERRDPNMLVGGRPAATVLEETVLDLAATNRTTLEVVGMLSDGFRKGMSRNRLLYALQQRKKYQHRKLVLDLLGEVDAGVESPLEYSYDQDVELAHGLPRSRRQAKLQLADGQIRSDRSFDGYQLRLELDGRFAHPNGRTDRDTWRDNAVLIKTGAATLRYRWANILGTPCRTAAQVAAALKQRGWAGTPKKCGPNCRVFDYQG